MCGTPVSHPPGGAVLLPSSRTLISGPFAAASRRATGRFASVPPSAAGLRSGRSLVSTRADGISIRTLPTAIGLSPSRVHQIVAAADPDALAYRSRLPAPLIPGRLIDAEVQPACGGCGCLAVITRLLALRRDAARTWMRSPCLPNRLRISTGWSPTGPNQCGRRVPISATSPGPAAACSRCAFACPDPLPTRRPGLGCRAGLIRGVRAAALIGLAGRSGEPISVVRT
jgi:hypothetical protein